MGGVTDIGMGLAPAGAASSTTKMVTLSHKLEHTVLSHAFLSLTSVSRTWTHKLPHTHTRMHNKFEHTNFHTQLFHAQPFTHNSFTRKLSHTHNSCTHSLSHKTFPHTTLSHTAFHTRLFHIQHCHAQPFLVTHSTFTHNSFTHSSITHTHTYFTKSVFPIPFSHLFWACWKKLTCGVIRSFIFFMTGFICKSNPPTWRMRWIQTSCSKLPKLNTQQTTCVAASDTAQRLKKQS